MNKIKIAYITSEDSKDILQWSGSSLGIYNCLKKGKFTVERIGPINNYIRKFLFILEIFFRFFKIKYDRDRNILVSKYFSRKISKKIKNRDYDYIVVHQGSLVSYLKTNIPIIIWTDLTFDLYQKNYFDNFRLFHSQSIINGNELENLALKKAYKVFYTSDYAKISAINKYNINPKKINIMPFGSNINHNLNSKNLHKIIDKRVITKKFLIKFLSVGTDWNRKGMDSSIKVIKKLRKKGINCELNIVGCKKPVNYELPDFVKIHSFLNKNILSERKKLMNFYKDSHYFILLSRAEAFGLVFNEAASLGLPSIATNIGGINSLIDNNSGVLIEKNENLKMIVKKIINIDKNNFLYTKLSINSFIKYKNENNWNITSKKLEQTLFKNKN